MVMDITSLSSNQAANSRGKVGEQPAAESKTAKNPNISEHTATVKGISLSDTAQALQKGIGEQLDDSSGVDEQRVAAFKLAIDNGTYNIDYESTARNLFQIESQLDKR